MKYLFSMNFFFLFLLLSFYNTIFYFSINDSLPFLTFHASILSEKFLANFITIILQHFFPSKSLLFNGSLL